MPPRIIFFGLLLTVVSHAAELRTQPGLSETNDAATINVQFTSEDVLTGVQFDLEYDATALDVKVETGPAAQSAGKVVQTATLGDTKQRVLLFGFNRRALAGGVVAILHISPKSNAARGRTYSIRLASPAGTDSEGRVVNVTLADAAITIQPFLKQHIKP